MKTKTYFTLAEYDEKRQAWLPQFGSYSKSDVQAELRESSALRSNLVIVTSGDDQISIDNAISAL